MGSVNANDVNLAMTTGAFVMGFNVRADNTAKKIIETEDQIELPKNNTIKDETLSALEVLGYTRKQSERILDTIIQSAPDSSVEELIKEALNKL